MANDTNYGPEGRPLHTHTLGAALIQCVGVLILRSLAGFLYRARMRYSRIRPPRPCVFACNHRSFFDPMIVGMSLTYPVAYFARADLWKIPIIGGTLRIMYGIPVDRENPGMSSMKGAVERLRQGISVLVFPEGTRTRTGRLGRLRDGPALFARRAGVAVVPVYVHRTECVWPRGGIVPLIHGGKPEIRFGPPLIAPKDLEPREQDHWVTMRLHAWMLKQERELLGPVPFP